MRRLSIIATALVVLAFVSVLRSAGQPIQYGHTWGDFPYDSAFAVETDPLGNVYIAGQVWMPASGNSVGFVAKIDTSGTVVWDRLIIANTGTWIVDMARGPTGDVFLLGESDGVGTTYVLRFSASGELLFDVEIIGFTSVYRIGVDPSTNGPIILGDYASYTEGLVVALDSAGQVRWSMKAAVPSVYDVAVPFGVAADTSGNVYLALDRNDATAGSADFGMAKFNAAGTLVGQQILALPDTDEYSWDLALAPDGNLVALGIDYTNYEIVLASIDTSLRPFWTELAGSIGLQEYMYRVAPQADGSIYAFGDTWSPTYEYLQAAYRFRGNGDLLSAEGLPHGWPGSDRVIYDATSAAGGSGLLLAGETWGSPTSDSVTIPNVTTRSIARSAWIDDTVSWETFFFETVPVDLLIADPVVRTDDFSMQADYQAWFGVVGTPAPELGVSMTATRTGDVIAAFSTSAVGGTPPYTYRWSFGDATFDTVASPTHVYPGPGRWFAQVSVLDSAGRSGYDTTIVFLTLPPDILLFDSSPDPAYVGQTVGFYADASDPDGGGIIRYAWDFGDGGTAETLYDAFASHVYAAAGNYMATLTVTDDESETSSTTIAVEVLENAIPIACFTWSPTTPAVNTFVTFDGRCSSDANGYITLWSWDFGDGTGGPFGLFAGHSYQFGGTYNVTLTVRDDLGAVGLGTSPITVTGPPRPTTTLIVSTLPNLPAKITLDDIPRNERRIEWANPPPGSHRISFGDIPGWITPGDVNIAIEEETTTQVSAQYSPMGFLRVTTEPALPATISVNGIPRDDWGLWMPVPAGVYTISFGAQANYAPPGPLTVSVGAGLGVHAIGQYTFDGTSPGPDPATFGMLRVTTELDDARVGAPSTISVDGVPSDEWALNFLKLPPGEYMVSFSDVPGLGTPAPQSVSIVAGQTTTVKGVFEVHGYLRIVNSRGLAVSISVDAERRNDYGMWQSMAPGTYLVSFGDFPGYATPPNQTVAVVAGQETYVVGDYVPQGAAATSLKPDGQAPAERTVERSASVVDGPRVDRLDSATRRTWVAESARLHPASIGTPAIAVLSSTVPASAAAAALALVLVALVRRYVARGALAAPPRSSEVTGRNLYP